MRLVRKLLSELLPILICVAVHPLAVNGILAEEGCREQTRVDQVVEDLDLILHLDSAYRMRFALLLQALVRSLRLSLVVLPQVRSTLCIFLSNQDFYASLLHDLLGSLLVHQLVVLDVVPFLHEHSVVSIRVLWQGLLLGLFLLDRVRHLLASDWKDVAQLLRLILVEFVERFDPGLVVVEQDVEVGEVDGLDDAVFEFNYNLQRIVVELRELNQRLRSMDSQRLLLQLLRQVLDVEFVKSHVHQQVVVSVMRWVYEEVVH